MEETSTQTIIQVQKFGYFAAELHFAIMEYVSWPRDICALSLVNKNLNCDANPLLYRTVVVAWRHPKRSLALLRRIEGHESLRYLVQYLNVDRNIRTSLEIYDDVDPEPAAPLVRVMRARNQRHITHTDDYSELNISHTTNYYQLKFSSNHLLRELGIAVHDLIPRLPNLQRISFWSLHPIVIDPSTPSFRLKRYHANPKIPFTWPDQLKVLHIGHRFSGQLILPPNLSTLMLSMAALENPLPAPGTTRSLDSTGMIPSSLTTLCLMISNNYPLIRLHLLRFPHLKSFQAALPAMDGRRLFGFVRCHDETLEEFAFMHTGAYPRNTYSAFDKFKATHFPRLRLLRLGNQGEITYPDEDVRRWFTNIVQLIECRTSIVDLTLAFNLPQCADLFLRIETIMGERVGLKRCIVIPNLGTTTSGWIPPPPGSLDSPDPEICGLSDKAKSIRLEAHRWLKDYCKDEWVFYHLVFRGMEMRTIGYRAALGGRGRYWKKAGHT